MQVELLNSQGQVVSGLELSDNVFDRAYNETLIHQLVVAYQANARCGTRAQKNREQVHHSTKKPFKQKGTGRARAGMTSSPLWRGGGRAFPSQPDENFSQKINKKMYRAGMACILSQLVRDKRLLIVESVDIDVPKTKKMVDFLAAVGLTQALVVVDKIDENLYLAARNLPNAAVVESKYIDPVSLLRYRKVLATKNAVHQIEEMFA